MRDNKGYSLIELVVVIAIMAVMIGLVSLGLSVIFGLDARECAQDLDGYINQAKTSALSKEGQKLKIYQDGVDNQYYVSFSIMEWKTGPTGPVAQERVTATEVVGKKSVTITYHLSDGTINTVGAGTDIGISFNRSSGAFEDAYVGGAKQSGIYCEKMIVKKGGKEYTIVLVPKTGKHYLQ